MITNSIIYSLTNFINENRERLKKVDVFDAFDEWQERVQVVLDYDEAIWSAQYIKQILECDADLIKEALEIDAKCIDKEFRNTKGPKLQSKYPIKNNITVSKGFNLTLADYLKKCKDCIIVSLYKTEENSFEFNCYYKELMKKFYGKSAETDIKLFYLDAVAYMLKQIKRPCFMYLLVDSDIDIISKENPFIKEIKALVEEKNIYLNIVVFKDTDKIKQMK